MMNCFCIPLFIIYIKAFKKYILKVVLFDVSVL